MEAKINRMTATGRSVIFCFLPYT